MSDTLLPPEISELLSELQFVSLVKPGEKINLSTRNFSHSSSWLGAALRTWHREKRNGTIEYIERLVYKTVSMLERYRDNDQCYGLLSQYLQRLVHGIDSTEITYADDPDILSRLDVVKSLIELHAEPKYG